MISAIAARKAKQAAQPQQGQQSTQSQPPPSGSLHPSIQSPKRKPTSQRAKPAPKRQKRDVNQKTKPPVVPTPVSDVSQPQDDMMIMGSDDEDHESALSEESDVEILSSPPPKQPKRVWSPSIPLHDSSSDEDITLDTAGLIDLPTRSSILPETSVGTILSNFISVPGQNTFFLSAGDIRKLGLGFGEEAKGTSVVLEQGNKICLLGACRLTLLKGSIRVNGVPMQPSTVPHNIFAPRSSPLPVVEYSAGDAQAVLDASRLPQALRSLYSSQCSLVLLQELWSNVEELGNVCRTFEGAYRPSKWQDDLVSSPFQIDGLYLVSEFFLYISLSDVSSRSRSRHEKLYPLSSLRHGLRPSPASLRQLPHRHSPIRRS